MGQDARMHARVSRRDVTTWGPVLLLTLIAAGLRLYHIGAKTLWLDEAFSLWMARHPLPELWRWLVRIDQHPPLYYTLLHFWLALGDSTTALRLLSAWLGVLTVPLMYGLGRTIGGHRLGLLAALLLTISPLHIQYGQEARMYALFTLAATLAMWGVAWLLRWPELAARPLSDRWRTWRGQRGADRRARVTEGAWLAYVIGTVAALLSHNTAVFLPLAANLVVLGWWWAHRPRRRGFLRNWLLAQAAVLVLWSVWLPAFVRQSLMVYREFWIPAPDLGRVLGTFQDLYSAFVGRHLVVRPWIDLLAWGLVGLGISSWRRTPRWIAFALAFWLVAPIGELIVSIWRPIFYIRTLVWIAVPLYLIMAAGLASLRSRVVYGAALAVLLVVNLGGAANYYANYQKEAWDQAAAYVAQRAQPNDLILFNATWVQLPFDYYFRRYGLAVTEHGVPVDLFDRGVLEPKMTRDDLPRLRALVRGHRGVWLVYSHNWYTDPQGLIPAALQSMGRLVDRRRFRGIQVYQYAIYSEGVQGALPSRRLTALDSAGF